MNELSRKGQLVVIIIAVAILFSGGYHYSQAKNSNPNQEILISGSQDQASATETNELVVHVAGEVVNPGIYTLNEGTRVIDAVNKAVATDNADINQLNLAAYLTNEQKIYVPPRRIAEESGGQGDLVEGAGAPTKTVNINTAAASQLESLPGIGPVLAERIIQYRIKNGPFASPEDLLNVSGIGNARFSEIKDLVSIY